MYFLFFFYWFYFDVCFALILDIIAKPACFLGPFDWSNFSKLFTLRQCLSLRLRYVSCMQQKEVFYFHIQSVSLCLFIGDFSPFILRHINDQWLLSPVNFVFFVGDVIVCVFPFFQICCCEIINYLCFCWCSSLPWGGVLFLGLCVGLGFLGRYLLNLV